MKRGKNGFTLAELLIVVAIIAVLVAVSIPIFTNQMEKSREATDLANVRAAYSEKGQGDGSLSRPSQHTSTAKHPKDKGTVLCPNPYNIIQLSSTREGKVVD